MIYYTVLLRRRDGLTQEEFERAWLGEHLALARQLPGLVEARFLPRADPETSAGAEAPDGLGILAFASREALDAALATTEAANLRKHTATFADSENAIRFIARSPE